MNALLDHEEWNDDVACFRPLFLFVEAIDDLNRVDAQKVCTEIQQSKWLRATLMTTGFGQLTSVKATEHIASPKRKMAAPRKLEVIVTDIEPHKHSHKI